MAFGPHTIGTQFVLRVSQPTVNLTGTPITLVLDGTGGTGGRIVLGYLNNYTDGVPDPPDLDGTVAIRFTKTSAWSAAKFADGAGPWDVRVLKGTAGTDQQEIGVLELTVNLPSGGVLPTTPGP